MVTGIYFAIFSLLELAAVAGSKPWTIGKCGECFNIMLSLLT